MFCGQIYTALDSHWGNGVEGKEGVGKLGEIISTEVSILSAVDPDVFSNQSSLPPQHTYAHAHTHIVKKTEIK